MLHLPSRLQKYPDNVSASELQRLQERLSKRYCLQESVFSAEHLSLFSSYMPPVLVFFYKKMRLLSSCHLKLWHFFKKPHFRIPLREFIIAYFYFAAARTLSSRSCMLFLDAKLSWIPIATDLKLSISISSKLVTSAPSAITVSLD